MATPRTTHEEVVILADEVMGGHSTRMLREVSDHLGIGYDAAKRLAANGGLPVVRVSARRIAVTRHGLVQYLCKVNGLDPATVAQPVPTSEVSG